MWRGSGGKFGRHRKLPMNGLNMMSKAADLLRYVHCTIGGKAVSRSARVTPAEKAALEARVTGHHLTRDM